MRSSAQLCAQFGKLFAIVSSTSNLVPCGLSRKLVDHFQPRCSSCFHCKMDFLRELLLVLLVYYRFVSAQKEYKCRQSSSRVCTLEGVQYIPNEEEIILLPENLQFVEIINGKLSTIDEDFYGNFGDPPVNFTVTNCGVEELFASPDFVHLNATGNKLKSVKINARVTYNLKVLIVAHNSLTRPPNVKDLTKLEHLDVSYNAINNINLEVFQRLVNLKILNLSGNKISSLDGPFRMGKLTELHLNNNELQEISVDTWNMPSLVTLDLSSNLLMYLNAEDLQEPFSQLRYLGLPGNQWNCRIMPKLLQSLQQRSIKFLPGSTRCPANMTMVQGVCCLDSYVNWVTLHSHWEIRKLEGKIQTLNATLLQDLAKVKSDQGKQIAELEQKIDTQEKLMGSMKGHLMSMEGLIEDLIEELYLREVENGATKKSDGENHEETENKSVKMGVTY